MASLEEGRLSLELSPENFRAYGMRLGIRAVDMPTSDTAAIAGKWAMRQQYPPNVLKLDPDAEAISRFPGIEDRVAVCLGWKFARCVGTFAVATEYAGRMIDAARDRGLAVYGIAVGADSEAGLYVVSPEGETPTGATLRELVEATNKELNDAGVSQLPMHSSLMFEHV